MEPSATIPTAAELATKSFTAQNWLQYYKNIWLRNAVARTVDVKVDEAIKAINPEELVDSDIDRGQVMTVKERLEHRKILVQDALDIVEAVEKLLAYSPEEFVKAEWSKEALAVAKDMMPVESNVMSENPEEVNAEHEKAVEDGVQQIKEKTPETPADEPASESNQA